MIELLVKYIQDKGYEVHILPGVLLIRKEANGQICSVDWAIPKHDLRPDFEEYLYYVAHRYMDMIEKAIAERMQAV